MVTRFLWALVIGVGAVELAWGQADLGALRECAREGIALDGYDIVSYFAAGGPVRGSREHAYEQDGVTFLFRDAVNRAHFLRHMSELLPDYGGWCATTVAHGALLCPDASNFKIENGRLLLFEVTAFTNGRAVWDSDPQTYRRRADENFARLKAQ